MEKSKEFLNYIVGQIAENSFTLNATTDEMGVLMTLQLHKDDMGKVIGRAGATAKAIRTVLRVVGMSEGARVNLKILEPEGGKYTPPAPESDADMLGVPR